MVNQAVAVQPVLLELILALAADGAGVVEG